MSVCRQNLTLIFSSQIHTKYAMGAHILLLSVCCLLYSTIFTVLLQTSIIVAVHFSMKNIYQSRDLGYAM